MRRNFDMNVTREGKNPKWTIVIPVFFALIGIGLIVFAFVSKNQSDKFMETAVPVSAQCTRIWMTTDTDDDGHITEYYHADVSYEYNGATYQGKDFDVDYDTAVGDTITIYIDPKNPGDARTEFGMFPFIIMLIFGGVFAGVGVFSAIGLFQINKENKPKAKVNDPWEVK